MKECGETVLDREKCTGRFIPREICQLNRSRANLRALEDMKSQPRFLGLHLVTILTDKLLQLTDGCASSSLSLRIGVTKLSRWYWFTNRNKYDVTTVDWWLIAVIVIILSSTQIYVNFHGWNHVSPIGRVVNLCQSLLPEFISDDFIVGFPIIQESNCRQ
jgi:hypothetical protein